jgi:hypothetical protein
VHSAAAAADGATGAASAATDYDDDNDDDIIQTDRFSSKVDTEMFIVTLLAVGAIFTSI